MIHSIKLILLASSALLVTACGSSSQEADSKPISSTESSVVETTVSVSFSFEEDEKELADLAKETDVQEGQSVLEALKDNYEVVEDGGLVSSIEGHEQVEKESKYWLYTVNDEQPTVGASDYVLEEGDEVKWSLNAY
ncbi:protein of unknown function [Desemzia incerta]|uniref:Transcobalamin-like C-terminal domain-containing protein n=1 Tax=Desemzia incerta TaxID=82801 RepID=A0A1I5V0N8_9LACT|nr:DUF4430 domain-containing protein [Desemzia incerta]SFQ01104.1 protein of unknown function [Desemzia incerta]